jgi:hypothetical protein
VVSSSAQINTGSFTGSFIGNITSSNVQLNNTTDTTATNKVLVLNTATNQIFTTASVGNFFNTIAVAGQSDVVADQVNDTLTFVAGTNVTITTNATNDSITINSSGGSGNAFPFSGSAIITGSLVVSGSQPRPSLQVLGSGSTVFAVSGSQGPLFQVTDSTAGDLFTLTSASINVFNVNNRREVNISGSLKITGSSHIIGNQEISGSLLLSSSNNNSPVTINGSTDSFFELEVVNFSAGNNASADVVVSSNNTTDFGNYAAFGINSTTFNGPLVGGPSDGYLYLTSSVGELDIGNASPVSTGNVRLFAGGPNSTNTTRVFISSSGNVGINTTTNLRNTLSVNGSVSASAGITGSLAQFNPAALRITVGTTAPASPVVNDLWVDTN